MNAKATVLRAGSFPPRSQTPEPVPAGEIPGQTLDQTFAVSGALLENQKTLRNMKTKHILVAGILAFITTNIHADTFGSGANTFTINFVTIGNPGNGNDAGAGGGSFSSPYGGVPYVYNMGVTEVAQDWVTKATNLGALNLGGGTLSGNQPATSMRWYQAAAFVNFLNTSTGHQTAYQLDAANTTLTLWSSAQAWQTGGENLYRNKDAYYFLPSENEWYKAAFHKNDGVTANYWDYATGSNTVPTAVAGGTTAGTVVYNDLSSSPVAVDNDGGLSAYGTRGQNGNAWEWQESAFDGTNNLPSEVRTYRGGDWSNTLASDLNSSTRNSFSPSTSSIDGGFRVASAPEPASAALLGLGALLLAARRRSHRARHGADEH